MENFKPAQCEVEKDKDYFWCSCGKSEKQPFCDGSHVGTDFNRLNIQLKKMKQNSFVHVKKQKISLFVMEVTKLSISSKTKSVIFLLLLSQTISKLKFQ